MKWFAYGLLRELVPFSYPADYVAYKDCGYVRQVDDKCEVRLILWYEHKLTKAQMLYYELIKLKDYDLKFR